MTISPETAQSRGGLLLRLKHLVGLDRAIAFTVMARGWSTLAGGVTILLIARFLNPFEQGYYYTFASLVALQILFELGFSFVILQLAAHERANLMIHADGSISGGTTPHSRLASILQKSVRWYSVAAVLMSVTLLVAGFWFFSGHQKAGPQVFWKLPWICAVLAAMFTFQMDPVFSFLEGCGKITDVARLRLSQAVLGNLLAWSAFLSHHGLFAPSLVITGQALAGAIFLYSQRSFLLPLLRRNTGRDVMDWRAEVWPFQWRIAASWLCGYFIFQLFNPVLFVYRGAVEAGRMGMSLTICAALGAISLSWVGTKASPFGHMIAQRDFVNLDKIFFRTLLQSSLFLILGALIMVGGYLVVAHRFPTLAARVLSLPLLLVLLLTTLLNHIVFSEAVYLRAHKKEPLLQMSIMVAILCVSSTIIAAKFWGPAGVTIGYFCFSGVFGVICATLILFAKRKEWHA